MKHFNSLLALLAASLIAIVAAPAAHAADTSDPPGIARLEGVWMTQISARDCMSEQVIAGPFPGLITFHAGGTASETGPSPPMSTRGPAHGTWRRVGRHNFVANVIFQRFDLNGFFIGTQVIRGNLSVAEGGDSYVAVGTFVLNDALGAQIGSGCSLVVATRF